MLSRMNPLQICVYSVCTKLVAVLRVDLPTHQGNSNGQINRDGSLSRVAPRCHRIMRAILCLSTLPVANTIQGEIGLKAESISCTWCSLATNRYLRFRGVEGFCAASLASPAFTLSCAVSSNACTLSLLSFGNVLLGGFLWRSGRAITTEPEWK